LAAPGQAVRTGSGFLIVKEAPIDDPRAEIDAIDSELLLLLNKRARVALRVGEAKAVGDKPLCDPSREREVLARLFRENEGPLDDKGVQNIFQRIIDESLHIQQERFRRSSEPVNHVELSVGTIGARSRVAFLGEPGTFSEEAALLALGDSCEAVSFPTFDSLFKAIGNNQAEYILAPLENSLIGSVRRCVDLLLESSLSIVAEILLPVSHYLIACPAATMDTIEVVESHPAALSQCERFFASYPHLTRVAADDTAGSVRRAIESGDVRRAAIGSKRAAKMYGGKILREHVEDHSDNFTRFALLSAEADTGGNGNKISLVLRLRHQPGSLHSALRPFVRRGIDLLKIESIPIRDSSGEFYFYLDIHAPAIEGDLQGALDELKDEVEGFRYLGRYTTVRPAAAVE
jgi:chorismate mutase / prephenate dehydratase